VAQSSARTPDPPRIAGPTRLALLMVGVCAAYYIASRVGLALRIPPATTSVMWPPNIILTMALMLTPTRRWAWCLAAALSAHFAVQGGTGWPPLLIVAFFATNSLEAIAGAGAFRWLVGTPPRIDSLRHMTLFIAVVAVGAPLLSSFPDAAVVNWFQGESFGLVVRRRTASNIMTTLTLLPAMLVLWLHLPRWLRRTHPRRWLEAGALTVSVATAAQFAVSPLVVRVGEVPVTVHTPLVLVLPFLLWAAVRFGTAGASLSLCVTALASVYSAIAHAAYTEPAAAEASVLTLQVFLIMLAIPLLCLAALVEERYRARIDLADRLEFEAVLARVSASFVHVPNADIPGAFEASLERLGRFLGLNRLVLLEFWPDGGAQPVATWTALERTQPRMRPLAEGFPWSMPLVVGGRAIGRLDCLAMADEWQEDHEVVGRLRQAADVFGNALARKQTDGALRESEALKSGILAALPNAVAVLDRRGEVVAVNQQWERAAADRSLLTLTGAMSSSYLEHCRGVERAGMSQARVVIDGVDAVLAGPGSGVTVEYCARPLELDRWFTVSVVPLGSADGGAVVTHTEVTQRRRAERSAQRSREELAQVTRVAAMGELAASLAHQVSQPLTGILSNAEQARRMVASSAVDLQALSGILGAIVEDDRRVGDVIQRLRELLRKGPAEQVRVDVNAVVRDVVNLVHSDAAVRNIQLTTDLTSAPLVVIGDRVQLAQALLNLIANAMDAVAAVESPHRVVTVTTESAYEAALVVVHDTGPGVGDQPEALFEPFFTTKPSGMGMGLPIVRTIVEAHGGRAWAANVAGNPGASAYVSLPLEAQASDG
jgi:signal transduction histidine kinase